MRIRDCTGQAGGWCMCAPCFKFVLPGGLFGSYFLKGKPDRRL